MELSQQWRHALVPIGSLVLISICACRSDRTTEIAAAIQELTNRSGFNRTDVREFYDARGRRPAWMTNLDVSKADAALDTLATASVHGLDPADYGTYSLLSDIERLKKYADSGDRVTELAE